MVKRVVEVSAIAICLFVAASIAAPEVFSQDAASGTSGAAVAKQTAAEKKAELEKIKKDAEAAKAKAEEAAAEAEKAQKEAELQAQAAELEKKRLEAEIQETEATKREAAIVKKTAKSGAEIRQAVAKTKQEEAEDAAARVKASAVEEKMLAARQKALLAAEELKLAQTEAAIALEELKKKEAEKTPLERAVESGWIILVGLLLLLVMRVFTHHFQKMLTKKNDMRESEATLRIKTAIKLCNWLGTVIIFGTVFFMVLEKNGLNVAPILAGAGIIGLAFSFGGQYLIRDLINGLFILIENQYRINDVVKIGEYGGLVEDINLRITTLRDLQGRVIIIPNGEIKTVVNYTREFAQALLDVGVAYKEDVDRVMAVIKEVGAAMRTAPHFKQLILEDLEMLGVDEFADSAVIIRFRLKTLPIRQWEVMREFRRRLKKRFDELGIEIPFPHRTLYWGAGQEPARG